MFRCVVQLCAPGCVSYRWRNSRKCFATLTNTKNLFNCGLTLMKKKVQFLINGPTAFEVVKDIDLSNKTCLLTGANSGIGLEMTRTLTSRGCAVLAACRNPYAAQVATTVCENTDLLRFYETNLASLRSVKNCSEELVAQEKNIDIVMLNASTFGLPWTLTEDNLETTFQVNFLSQFYLLMNIEKILAPDARVVFMSSESHRNIKWSFEDQMVPSTDKLSLTQREYTSIKAYNVSKLCTLLSMHYLEQRWRNSNKSVFCAHPGSFVKTRLCRNWWAYEALYTMMLPFSKTISQAACTPLYCATSPDLQGSSGLYIKERRVCEPSALAQDRQLALRVHDLAIDMLRKRVAPLADGTPDTAQHTAVHDNNLEMLTPTFST